MSALPFAWAPTPAPNLPFDLFQELERLIPQQSLWSTRREAGQNLPQPFRDLLVHDRDMTSTLERFHHESLLLEVLHRELRGTRLNRRVRLRGQRSNTVHATAGVSIHLEKLPLTIQAMVLAGRRPLGAILAEAALPYRNEPQLFFRLDGGERLAADLEVAAGTIAWGRRNQLWSSAGLLAEVIEVLPPVAD